VVARRPRLVYIFMIRGFAAERTLEPLISNPLESEGICGAHLGEWALPPLISNCTL
jgi:hypothetical protein